jgi:hypothetical protein
MLSVDHVAQVAISNPWPTTVSCYVPPCVRTNNVTLHVCCRRHRGHQLRTVVRDRLNLDFYTQNLQSSILHFSYRVLYTIERPRQKSRVSASSSKDGKHTSNHTQRNVPSNPKVQGNLGARHAVRSCTRGSSRSNSIGIRLTTGRLSGTCICLTASSGDGGWNVRATRRRRDFRFVANCRKLGISLDLPGSTRELRTRRWGQRRFVVVGTNARGSKRGPVFAQVLEIGVPGYRRAIPAERCIVEVGRSRLTEPVIDQTIVVGFLDPLVDDGAGPGVYHFVAKDGCLIIESSSCTDIAAGLGEKDGNVVLRGVLLQGYITGGFVSGVAAPGQIQ